MDNQELELGMRVEIYERQPIQTVRSYLIRRSNHELAEYPRPLTEDEADLMIHPTYKSRDLTEEQKVLYSYIHYLALLNTTGYHQAINDAFTACMEQCQTMSLAKAIQSKEVTDAFKRNEDPA